MSIPKGYNAETGLMTFSLALDEMKAGRKVRRRAWVYQGGIRLVKDAGFVFDDGKCLEFGFDTAQVLAEDWETVL